ncbi:MAG: signal peptidase I [Lawsonella sp.]|nr:signal peptidase I [Mycobacteriales bacterium]
MFSRKKDSENTAPNDVQDTAESAAANEDAATEKGDEKTKRNPALNFLKEVAIILVIALAISALVQNVIARVYVIPSESMMPTLQVGDRILVEKISYNFNDPEPGDVVVFEGTDSWNEWYESNRSDQPVIKALQDFGSFVGLVPPDENNLVKRVIAVGGQTVRCQPGDKGITVDDRVIPSDYTLYPPVVDWGGRENGSNACGGPYFGPFTVPQGFLWVMGDNRTDSGDSRYHTDGKYKGMIPLENVRGKVISIIWPIGRWQKVQSVDF